MNVCPANSNACVNVFTFLCSEKLQSVADEVFEDVVDEFSTLPTIRQHFEQWKTSYPDSYSQAFMSLCLPKVVAPFARLQMLMWNPLQVSWMQSQYFLSYCPVTLNLD